MDQAPGPMDDNFVWNKIEQLSWPERRVSWMRRVMSKLSLQGCIHGAQRNLCSCVKRELDVLSEQKKMGALRLPHNIWGFDLRLNLIRLR